MRGTMFFRLENVGPTGQSNTHTSNRAELRAVVAALDLVRQEKKGLEFWEPKEAARLVIATDSTYVMYGATKWANGTYRTVAVQRI